MTEALPPGTVIGMLGGGQLGRMFALAARRLGYGVHVLAPGENPPAGQLADRVVRAAFDDIDAVEQFARDVSVVTFEFENVLAVTSEAAARHAPVRPSGTLLHTTQHRLREKRALQRLGLPVANFHSIATTDELAVAQSTFTGRGVLKTASWGYDGKGQCRVDGSESLADAWKEIGSQPAVLEVWVPFEREISVVGARGVDGSIELYDPFENAHSNHVLDITTIPASISDSTRRDALEIARVVLEGLDVVGVLCVELFQLADGKLVVNELAPRPHNSGHLTIDAHETCQFEQQVRAVCGLPLGSPKPRVGAAAMANLLGDLWESGEPNWAGALAQPGIQLHLYGKTGARPGRKMGHLVATGEDCEEVKQRAIRAREALQSAIPSPSSGRARG